MTDQDAMKLALEALETEVSIDWTNDDEFNASAEKMHEAIAALKKQLADYAMRETQRLGQEIEQEPVAWLVEFENGEQELHFDEQSVGEIHTPLYTHPPQRTEQNFCPRCGKRTKDLTHIHTCTPPRRTRVGLTIDELITLEQKHIAHEGLSRAIEAIVKEKNGE